MFIAHAGNNFDHAVVSNHRFPWCDYSISNIAVLANIALLANVPVTADQELHTHSLNTINL